MADPPPPGNREVAPTPAATVVPLRDGEGGLEVLLLRRNTRGTFGGMWVFPGGQVDPDDLVRPADGRQRQDVEVDAARRAAVREAREEAGLELEEARLVTLSFWLPPATAPRRFATWFFLAPATDHLPVVVDEDEIHEHRWHTPAQAMALRNSGAIELVPPTFTTLWWLAHHGDVGSALAAAGARAPERYESRIVVGADRRVRATVWEGDAGYHDGDLDRPGPRRRLELDPDGWRVEITV
jgi:8-oxo-dGTP pyrophosphatase MutT (NUDIX family)